MNELNVYLYSPDQQFKLCQLVEFVGLLDFSSKDIKCFHCIYAIEMNSLQLSYETINETHSTEDKIIEYMSTMTGIPSDNIALRYLLYFLVLKQNSMNNSSLTSKPSLNLIVDDDRMGGKLESLLQELLPIVVTHSVTLEQLNSTLFQPQYRQSEMNEEHYEIVPGPLMAANSSLIIFDETKLMTGDVNEIG